ncbi:MAG: DUF1800 domain-containing protein [Chloroflexi bacterium]|nr:DUF1800 domain-containing protein [Chloroflexota bacterium]
MGVRGSDVKVSRRRFLAGAGAAAAFLSAGGASAGVWLHERGSAGTPLAEGVSSDVTTQSGPSPLDDPATRLRHLLRRTSFAALPADVKRYDGVPYAQVVDDLLAQDGRSDAAADAYVAGLGFDTQRPADVIAAWVARMVRTERPAVERMTLFWHGLLTSGLSKTPKEARNALLVQNDLFRSQAFGRFDVLLRGVVRDPAMMFWLDIHTSKKGRPNENYARELMEMFTLGVGHYTEQDVRESARAHTGYGLDRARAFVFRPAQHDGGTKTFLGETGNFDADAIVDIVLRQEAAPEHFARRLFETFAYPDAEPAVIGPIAAVARATAFDTRQVLRAVLVADAFSSRRAYRALVKSPVEFLIGAVRQLQAEMDPRSLGGALRAMGQTLFDPPNVEGWPGGASWMGTSTWFARVNAAARLTNAATTGAQKGRGTMLEAVFATRPDSAQAAVEQVAMLVDGGISDEARATLEGYLDDGGSCGSLAAAAQDARLGGLLTLLLSSPEYQLA